MLVIKPGMIIHSLFWDLKTGIVLDVIKNGNTLVCLSPDLEIIKIDKGLISPGNYKR